MSAIDREQSLKKFRMYEIRNIFNTFFHNESAGGIVLIICTALAIIAANTGLMPWLVNIWDKEMGISVGNFSLKMSLLDWVNDGLMAIFFFVVGLEIKREMLVGELSSLKHAALPIFAAIGGMLVPAVTYFMFNSGNPFTEKGWGIPMATDIAFAIGIVSLLGKRVPLSLKVFLTALAIVDDLGAIIVLALFYPAHALDPVFLLYAAGIVAGLALLNFLNIRNKYVYIIAGVFLWYFVYRSGVHATIAGVLLAAVTPARSVINELRFGTKLQYLIDKFKMAGSAKVEVIANPEQQHIIHTMHSMINKADPLMHKFESTLHPWVTFMIMPVFALANAGVALNGSALGPGDGIPDISLGIFFGLFIGKPLGIFLFSWLATRAGLARKPEDAKWRQIVGIGILGGIGFTMSIFINNLAFPDSGITDIGKVTILFTSLCSAIIGLTFLFLVCKKQKNSNFA